MTVYNVTKLNPSVAKAVAKYLGVTTVQLTYSDWLIEFGVRVKDKSERNQVPKDKRERVKKYLMEKLGDDLEVFKCPVMQ